MSVSGIQSSSAYTALASGSRINKAADDAAGLAISEKLQTGQTGFEVGSSNAQDGISLINVADGALAGMQDSLQRMHELAVKAKNGLYSDSDRAIIQQEINGLKDTIQGLAKDTTFNTKKLLDGSMADVALATNPEGSTLEIQLENSTLESLGIADFDVTGDFDLETLRNAMSMVSRTRSGLGATSNVLEHTIKYNDYANYNLTAADSRIRDTDYAEEMIKKNRDEVLQKYRIFGIKAKAEKDAGVLRLF